MIKLFFRLASSRVPRRCDLLCERDFKGRSTYIKQFGAVGTSRKKQNKTHRRVELSQLSMQPHETSR